MSDRPVDSLAARGARSPGLWAARVAFHSGYGLRRRIWMAGALSGCLATTMAPAPEARTSAACPAQSFSAFVDAFAESAALQRRFTRVPFEYGHLDQDLAVTGPQDQAFSTRTVNSFDAIPLFDWKDDGRIFPSKKKRLKWHLEIGIGTDDEERHANHIIATVGIPDTGFRLQYRFVKTDNCWMLVVIDDRSI
jgi:hypothetical protein